MADAPLTIDQREFRCSHCDGLIRIPRELPPTTGPCPHCSGIITSPAEEISRAAQAPPPAPPAASVPAPMPEAPPLQSSASPLPITAPPVLGIPAVPTGPPPLMSERSGSITPSANPAKRNTDDEKATTAASTPVNRPEETLSQLPVKNSAKPQRSGFIPLMLVLLVLGIILLGVVYYLIQELGKNITPSAPDSPTGASSSINEANYIRVGWHKDANRLLVGYMAGTSPQEKVPYLLHGETLAPKIEAFYGNSVIDDSDTPADGFSVYELPEKDRQSGLFMMIYDLPPRFDIKEFFRPLASLEVQHGLDPADFLLGSLARAGNFTTEPVRFLAFFKRTDKGLKLDWETFVQTKYRTFLDFVELPDAGHAAVFRVHIQEGAPEKGILAPGTRIYRLFDPANRYDSARVNVKIDSEIGRLLSAINWRDGSDYEPVTPTATVELKWNGESDDPELVINRFICWEFLGLGGEQLPATAAK